MPTKKPTQNWEKQPRASMYERCRRGATAVRVL